MRYTDSSPNSAADRLDEDGYRGSDQPQRLVRPHWVGRDDQFRKSELAHLLVNFLRAGPAQLCCAPDHSALSPSGAEDGALVCGRDSGRLLSQTGSRQRDSISIRQ